MVMCAIFGCSNRSDTRGRKKPTNGHFYSVPKVVENQCERTKALSTKRRGLWLARINRTNFDTENRNLRVCGAHFITGKPAKLFDETNPDWAPSLLLGYSAKNTDPSRHRRLEKRRAEKRQADAEKREAEAQTRRAEADAVATGIQPCSDQPISPHETGETYADESDTGVAVQTEMTMEDIQLLEQQCTSLNERLYVARIEKEELEFSENSLRSCERKVTFYTGMANFAVLLAVFKFLESAVPHSINNRLSKFQEFILFMMKIKVNLFNADLAFRFNISEATVSRIFDKWLHVAYCRLKSQITWPGREELQRTMPQAFFDSFGTKVAVIIDCFEIKIERPSSLLSRSETWSTYKGSNTAKFLIAIAPQGVVTYISEGWGGRVSDKHITEHCGLLDNLVPGDVVLADRGFNIEDSVGFYCARLHLPAYTKGKKQLSPEDVERTRKLANVRIHVERVIGLIRNKFVFLKSTVPINYVACREGDELTALDKIVTVCCALGNLCPPIVAALKNRSEENED